MLGLTPLGTIHTAISLVAVAAALIAFARDGRIVTRSTLGRVYVVTTVLTCLTGFGIFRHGGFGVAHVLGVITLVVLGVAVAAARTTLFGRRSAEVETVSMSATFLFHMIPAITETTTRVPPGAPWVSGPEAPELRAATGVLFALFVAGAAWQVRRLRARRHAAALPDPPVTVAAPPL